LWVLRSGIDPPGRTTQQGQQGMRKAPWLSPGGFSVSDRDRLSRSSGSQRSSCPSGPVRARTGRADPH
jgi:hypothetical protein